MMIALSFHQPLAHFLGQLQETPPWLHSCARYCHGISDLMWVCKASGTPASSGLHGSFGSSLNPNQRLVPQSARELAHKLQLLGGRAGMIGTGCRMQKIAFRQRLFRRSRPPRPRARNGRGLRPGMRRSSRRGRVSNFDHLRQISEYVTNCHVCDPQLSINHLLVHHQCLCSIICVRRLIYFEIKQASASLVTAVLKSEVS